VDFITGKEKRAPQLMQKMGLEWVFRLLQSPRRLAGRYLVRGPRVFAVLRRIDIRLKAR
jgi:exopolysaccharide biosynthesis WecB/TagA/CpsF family protein